MRETGRRSRIAQSLARGRQRRGAGQLVRVVPVDSWVVPAQAHQLDNSMACAALNWSGNWTQSPIPWRTPAFGKSTPA